MPIQESPGNSPAGHPSLPGNPAGDFTAAMSREDPREITLGVAAGKYTGVSLPVDRPNSPGDFAAAISREIPHGDFPLTSQISWTWVIPTGRAHSGVIGYSGKAVGDGGFARRGARAPRGGGFSRAIPPGSGLYHHHMFRVLNPNLSVIAEEGKDNRRYLPIIPHWGKPETSR